jgi:hypothetical protein
LCKAFIAVSAIPSYILIQEKESSVKIDDSPIASKQFDPNFKEAYNSEEFVYERTLNNSGWWTDFKRAWSEFWRDFFNSTDTSPDPTITTWLFRIAGLLIFILVIYFIVKAIMNDEGSWVFGKASDKHIIPIADVANNIHESNFKQLVNEASTDLNYRLAVRYYYLWVLKELNAAKFIHYDVEKTNSDYQFELLNTEMKKPFLYTSYLYNYIWYGEFEVNTLEFEKARTAFDQLLNQISGE